MKCATCCGYRPDLQQYFYLSMQTHFDRVKYPMNGRVVQGGGRGISHHSRKLLTRSSSSVVAAAGSASGLRAIILPTCVEILPERNHLACADFDAHRPSK